MCGTVQTFSRGDRCRKSQRLFWTPSGKNPQDRKSAEADELLHQHHRFADSVALFQDAIVLSAVAALTRMRLVWLGSMLVGLIGAGLFLVTIL